MALIMVTNVKNIKKCPILFCCSFSTTLLYISSMARNAHNHEWLLYISAFHCQKLIRFYTNRQVLRGRVNEAETSKFV